jgi:hypothetical protein
LTYKRAIKEKIILHELSGKRSEEEELFYEEGIIYRERKKIRDINTTKDKVLK